MEDITWIIRDCSTHVQEKLTLSGGIKLNYPVQVSLNGVFFMKGFENDWQQEINHFISIIVYVHSPIELQIEVKVARKTLEAE